MLADYKAIPGIKDIENMRPEDGQKNVINVSPYMKEQTEELKNLRLFRVMRKSHFLNWVLTGKNILVSAEKWDDPWERALFKQKIQYKTGEIIHLSDFRFFGQCWSMNENETDVIWRVFNAHGEDCVRVEVNALDLWKCFTSSVDKMSRAHGVSNVLCYCGKVLYLKESDAVNYLQSSTIEEMIYTNSLFNTMFVKRDGFSHENEFRIIYYPTSVAGIEGADCSAILPVEDLFAFDMDVSYIRSVLFGPALSSKYEVYKKHKEDFEIFKSSLAGKRIGEIKRSTLYDFPTLNVSYA